MNGYEEVLDALVRAAELSRQGAAERRIETAVVRLLELLGWDDGQIEQDVPISDKDRADILIKANENDAFLFEVKRCGQITKGADAQIERYSRLMRPVPRLAFLTDGIHWLAYFVGRNRLVPLFEVNMDENQDSIPPIFDIVRKHHVSLENLDDLSEFVRIFEVGLDRLSHQEQSKYQAYLAVTLRHLLGFKKQMPNALSQDPQRQPALSTHVGAAVAQPEWPDLTHSKIRRGHFGDEAVTSWSQLAVISVRSSVLAGVSRDEIHQRTSTNLRDGAFRDKGYFPVPGTEMSLQRMDANRCWRTAISLARRLSVAIEIEVAWGQKSDLSGQIRTLRWPLS